MSAAGTHHLAGWYIKQATATAAATAAAVGRSAGAAECYVWPHVAWPQQPGALQQLCERLVAGSQLLSCVAVCLTKLGSLPQPLNATTTSSCSFQAAPLLLGAAAAAAGVLEAVDAATATAATALLLLLLLLLLL
jgi:hypothetical protein